MELRLQDLTKRFGEKLAVEIPALTIHPGEFFCFVGPSGCGKSTTLNLIAGLEAPTGGQLWLAGRLLNDLSPPQRDVAFVFQSYALYPHRTVADNLSFPLEMAKSPKKLIRQRVHEVAELLGLLPLLNKHPRQLSGGERQRVALGRAIVRQPKLFLLDEPLSNLDAPLRAQMRKELKDLHARLGTTFIYVTHDQEEALSLSDRIAVMQAGRIQQCGPPGEIYDRPVNVSVASFFGSPPMNFLEGRLDRNEGLWFRIAEHGLRLQAWEAQLPYSDAVILGVRPEHLGLCRNQPADGWPVRISRVELHGGQCYLELEANGAVLTAVAPADAGYQPGEKAWIAPRPDRLHLFDPKTGQRIGPPALQ
jgi:multiple sugar transport system ATP-binding protein